jgi:hypothetical protein
MKIRLGLIVFAIATIAACQSAPAPDGEAALVAGAAGPSEGPELVCRMELVAGSRVRKQEVCSPAKFNGAAGDSFRQHLNNDLNQGIPSDAGGG